MALKQPRWMFIAQKGLGQMRTSPRFQQAVHNVCDSHSDHRPWEQWVSAFL